MVELKKITILDDNMKDCIALDVAPEKEDYVWTNAMTLAVAHKRYKRFSAAMECRAIYIYDKMIGLVAYNYCIDHPDFKETCYRIRPIMVDKNHIGKGYETEAIRQLIAEIKTNPHGEATAIFATYSPSEADMAALYKNAGFTSADTTWEDPDDDDVIVRMGL